MKGKRMTRLQSIDLIALRYIDVGTDVEEVVLLHGDLHML